MEAQQQAVELLKQECESLEERYPGYRVDAAKCLMDVLRHERDARLGHASPTVQVTRVVSAFGDRLSLKIRSEGGDSR